MFLALKIIKNRLRSSLCQELLESLMLFNVERDFEYDYNDVINTLGSSSQEMAKLLSV